MAQHSVLRPVISLDSRTMRPTIATDSVTVQLATLQDAVTVRPATAQDYAGVLDINYYIYGGFDYLPALYFWLFHNPDVNLFVAGINGRIVGFTGRWRFGDVIIAIASRVAHDFQSYGLSKMLNSTVWGIMERKIGRPFHIASVQVLNEKLHPGGNSVRNPLMKIVRKWHHFDYVTELTHITRSLELVDRAGVTTPTRPHLQETLQLMEDKQVQELLTTDGPVVVGYYAWLPLLASGKPLRWLAQQSTVLVSRDGQRVTAISFNGCILLAEGTFRVDNFYYGVHDVSILRAHVCTYLADVIRAIPRDSNFTVRVTLQFPQAMEPDLVEEALRGVFGSRFTEGYDSATTGNVAVLSKNMVHPAKL